MENPRSEERVEEEKDRIAFMFADIDKDYEMETAMTQGLCEKEMAFKGIEMGSKERAEEEVRLPRWEQVVSEYTGGIYLDDWFAHHGTVVHGGRHRLGRMIMDEEWKTFHFGDRPTRTWFVRKKGKCSKVCVQPFTD